jgi:hypothetical protein
MVLHRCSWLSVLFWLPLAPVAEAADDYLVPPAKREHWAWKAPAAVAPRAVQNAVWVRNPVDAFVLARLEAAGLPPTAPATREQLLRRVTLDLTGLPPDQEDIDVFLSDSSPNAWERVVDRLLASPHYGEHWGRHWLDLARFAESNGYEHDEVRPDAWRYRDYVIAAFNDNKPYDRFLKEQLAGDELYPHDPAALVATGFNLLGPDMTDASDAAQRRQNTLNDMTDTASLVFLGLTLGCARCHDHKFEPIPQTDYYRLQAFFAPAVFRRDLPIASAQQRAAYEAAQHDYDTLVKPLREEIATLEGPYRKKLHAEQMAKLADEAQLAHQTPSEQRTAAQKELVEKTARLLVVSPQSLLKAMTPADQAHHGTLLDRLKQFDGRRPSPLPVTMGLNDAHGAAPKTFLLERGELSNPVDEMQPGFPVILTTGTTDWPSGGMDRRSALANWMVRADHPLTARVLVNRLWQHHFGQGLVATPSDFGIRGQPPTHPELLDWLAVELVRSGWDIKHLHRLLLTSATYQQSSHASAEALARDPHNHLLSRMNRLRLEGEAIRDSLLSISGRLNTRMGGPGVFPPVPPETLRGGPPWTVSADPRDRVRRSVYIFAGRNLRFPFLEAFDQPDTNLSCPKRERSTTAPQALALLNATEVLEAAQSLAARLNREPASDEERILRAYRLVLGRQPTATELRLSREFLVQSPLSELCRALFNLNEFVYLD